MGFGPFPNRGGLCAAGGMREGTEMRACTRTYVCACISLRSAAAPAMKRRGGGDGDAGGGEARRLIWCQQHSCAKQGPRAAH